MSYKDTGINTRVDLDVSICIIYLFIRSPISSALKHN